MTQEDSPVTPAAPDSSAPIVEPDPAILASATDTPATETVSPPPGPHKKKKKKHKARVEHKIPGRVRMKIPTAANDPSILEHYRVAFAAMPGVTRVKTNPVTGSIVVDYDVAREAEFERHFFSDAHEHETVEHTHRIGDEIGRVVDEIEAEAEFLAGHSELAKAAVDFCKSLDRQLKVSTGNTIDLKIVIAGGLTAYTIFEIGAHAATPMWVTLAIFSLNHFAELQVAGRNQAPAPAPAPLQAL